METKPVCICGHEILSHENGLTDCTVCTCTKFINYIGYNGGIDRHVESVGKIEYQPKTGARCGCKRGVMRDNCGNCEGTGWIIDFAQIRARSGR